MIDKYKFGSCLPTFASCADRYCLSGYGGGGSTMIEMLDLATKVEGLDGVELVGNWHVNDDNIKEIPKVFSDRGLEVSMLTPDLWTQAKWGRGSLAAPDAATRQAAVDEIKKVIDWAAELGCKHVDIWPGQDGYDYSFQADYIEAWKWLTEGIAAVADHNPEVRPLVEYKPKEPRRHCFVSHFGNTLLLLKEFNNVGVLLDWGHALQGGENIAEATAMLALYGKLDYLHLNDNYGSWDDDMLVASVHVVEYLEWFYWLKKVNYSGWLTLDIFPYREDGIRAATESRDWIKGLFAAIDRIGMDEFERVIKEADGCSASALVRNALLGA